jgi:hypothetical protein
MHIMWSSDGVADASVYVSRSSYVFLPSACLHISSLFAVPPFLHPEVVEVAVAGADISSLYEVSMTGDRAVRFSHVLLFGDLTWQSVC